MPNLFNPLQQIINEAALSKPKTKTVEQYAQRLNPKNASGTLLLLDISSSMNERVGQTRKIDLLRRVLDRPLHPGETVIAFHSVPEPLSSLHSIPEPEGGTALHLAIAASLEIKQSHTLIVSDGKPDDEQQALQVAKKLTGTISTLYIGNDDERDAIAFMRKLARLGCGATMKAHKINEPSFALMSRCSKGVLFKGSLILLGFSLGVADVCDLRRLDQQSRLASAINCLLLTEAER